MQRQTPYSQSLTPYQAYQPTPVPTSSLSQIPSPMMHSNVPNVPDMQSMMVFSSPFGAEIQAMEMAHMGAMSPFGQVNRIMASFGAFHNDPFMSAMMMGINDPFEEMFKFSDIHKNMHERKNEGSFVMQSFVSSSKMGPDGQLITQNYFENNMGQHRQGNTISQKQQAYKNTSGVNRIAQQRMLNDQGRKIVRQKIGNNVQETNHYYNIDEEEAGKFDRQWRQADQNLKFLQRHQNYLSSIQQQPQARQALQLTYPQSSPSTSISSNPVYSPTYTSSSPSYTPAYSPPVTSPQLQLPSSSYSYLQSPSPSTTNLPNVQIKKTSSSQARPVQSSRIYELSQNKFENMQQPGMKKISSNNGNIGQTGGYGQYSATSTLPTTYTGAPYRSYTNNYTTPSNYQYQYNPPTNYNINNLNIPSNSTNSMSTSQVRRI